jgi:PAS domain S-box-containing protein
MIPCDSRQCAIGAGFVHPIRPPREIGLRRQALLGAVALAATAATLGLRVALEPALGGQPALTLFVLPILLCAWLGGCQAGLLATGLSVLAADVFLLPPTLSLEIAAAADRWQLLFIGIGGLGISLICESLHRAQRRAELAATRSLEAEKHAEAALEEAAGLRAALDEHAIVAITDASGRITFVNDKFCAISKYSREELLGQDHRIINSGLHPQEFFRDLWATIGHGRVWKGEIRNRAKDGSFYWVETTIVPFLDAEGKPRQYIAIRDDITRLKTAEESLRALNADLERRVRERTAELQSLFESLPGLYLVLTPDLRIIAASNAYLAATMTKREDIVGRGIFDAFPDDPADPDATGVANLRASFEHVLKKRTAHTMAIQRYDIRQPGGAFEVRYWSPINSPVPGADGEIKYIIHRVEDVTEFVQQQPRGDSADMQARLQQMEAEIFQSSQKVREINQQLEAANKELESFSYSVSHDLRSPLRSIDGFSQALIEDCAGHVPENAMRYLGIIRESAQQMGALIDDLLAFSRLGRAPLEKRTVDTAILVREVLEELVPQHAGRKIEIRTNELPACEADPALLRQVWLNLLANAFKYTRRRDPAVIEIGCEPTVRGEAFFVRDNGAGFDMRYVDKLFGVFQRLHRAEDYEGTGVGLALVQRIVHRHGGQVWAEAAVDRGATFRFTLTGEPSP